MRKALIEYECPNPNCNGHFGAFPELAGQETTCSYCKTGFMIPVGVAPTAMVTVDDDDEAIEETRQVVQKRKPKDGPVPVKMRMPGGYGELELPVRQGTADRMATTFLGALIMAIGVVLAAMLGLKKKS